MDRVTDIEQAARAALIDFLNEELIGQARRYQRRMRRVMRRAVTVTVGVFETPAGTITVHKIPRRRKKR